MGFAEAEMKLGYFRSHIMLNYPGFAFDLLHIWLSDFVAIRLNQSSTVSCLVLHASSDNVVEHQLAPAQ
jgi:hypothetical protein